MKRKSKKLSLEDRILRGLARAGKKAIEDSIKYNVPLVVSENGKIKLIKPSDL